MIMVKVCRQKQLFHHAPGCCELLLQSHRCCNIMSGFVNQLVKEDGIASWESISISVLSSPTIEGQPWRVGPDRWQPVQCHQAGAEDKRKAGQVALSSSRSSPSSAHNRMTHPPHLLQSRLFILSLYNISFQILSYHISLFVLFYWTR